MHLKVVNLACPLDFKGWGQGSGFEVGEYESSQR